MMQQQVIEAYIGRHLEAKEWDYLQKMQDAGLTIRLSEYLDLVRKQVAESKQRKAMQDELESLTRIVNP
jgi:hypothetical protein